MSINIAIALILVAYGNVHFAFAVKALVYPQEGPVKYAQYCIPDSDNSDKATIFCRCHPSCSRAVPTRCRFALVLPKDANSNPYVNCEFSMI